MSDIDSINYTDSSEVDRRRRAGDSALKEQNETLLKENAYLQSQFAEALKISDQVSKLYNVNNELRNKITDLSRENEDLQQRLTISIQSYNELKTKLNDEKKSSSSIRGADLNSMNKQIENVRKQSKAQIDQMYEQLERARNETERESLEKRHLVNQINNIIEEAQRYFNLSFKNVDDLLKHLSTPPISADFSTFPAVTQSTTVASQSRTQPSREPDQQLQRKVKHLKKQLREEQNKGESLENDIKRLSSELRQARSSADNEVGQLRDRIDVLESENKALQHQKETMQHQYSDQIENYESRLLKKNNEVKTKKQQIKALKKQIRDQRLENAAAGFVQPADDDKRSVSSKVSTSSTASTPSSSNRYSHRQFIAPPPVDSSANERVHDLTEQLNETRRKKDELAHRLREAEDKINQSHLEISKLHTEYDTLRRLYDNVKEEREAFRNVITKKEETAREIQEKQKNAPKQPNPRVIKLQKALDAEKQKVYTLQNNESKLQGKIDDLESAMRLLQQSANDAKDEARKATDELNDTRRQVENNQPPTADDLLPPSCYRCDDFDPTLSSAIGRIANNSALQPVSKIQNCFKTIKKYYSKQISERDEALDQAFSENQTLSSAFHQFLVDASIALCNQAVTLQDFFANNAGQKLVEQISQLRTSYADLKHQVELQRGFANSFTANFGEYISEPVDPVRALSEVKDRLDSQKVQIQARSKKIHDLKSQLKNSQNLLKTRGADIEREKEELEQQKHDLESRLATLNKTVNDLRQQNQSLTTDLEVANRTLEETQMTISQEQEDHNTTMLEEAATKEAALRSDLKKRSNEVKQLKAQVAENNKNFNNLKSQMTQLRNEKKHVEDEYEELKNQFREAEKQAQIRLDAEKRNITQSYDAAINELKEQCDKHRKDVERMAAEASESDLRYATATQEIAQLKKEKRKLESDIQTTRGQLEREKKLMETKIRAEKVQAESNYNAKLEEQKVKAEAEKRKLFALGADAFRNFFNPNEQIDERSFKLVLERARDTIARLNKSDNDIRRMLGAGEGQTTPDAVAQLLMSKNS